MISPEYDQSTGSTAAGGALDWTENLVKSYPNRKVIVMSDYLLNGDATFSTQGNAIYNRLKIYPNFILMICGHIVANTGESRRSDTYNGNTVQTIMSDYQGRTNGGNGLLRIYELDPSLNNVAVQKYSPYTNTYETDASSQFNLPVNLSTNVSYTLIGEVSNVSSGTNSCVNWPSLEQNADYEWYVEVFDGQFTTTSATWSFTTNAPIASSSSSTHNKIHRANLHDNR